MSPVEDSGVDEPAEPSYITKNTPPEYLEVDNMF